MKKQTPNALETLERLEKYNAWRRGDEGIDMPDPAEIGATIDDAVTLLRRHTKTALELARLRAGIAKTAKS